MAFVGKDGICNHCKAETLIVCKGLCQKCYMKERNNRKDIKKKKREWEKENKWKRKLRQAERLIMIRTKKFVPINLLKEIFERDNYTCQYCGSQRDLSIDHKIPISKGGKSDKENMIVACITCNSLKSDMSVEEFKGKAIKQVIEKEVLNVVG